MNPDNLIIRLAARGDGIMADGRHVPMAAPGDRLQPGGGLMHGPHHINPSCRHFPLCGGCQLQHVDDSALTEFVHNRVVYALAGQGLEADDVMPVHLSPPRTRRRVALRSGWAGRRFQLGFSTEKSHRIIDLDQCDVMAPALFAQTAQLRKFLTPLVGAKRSVQTKLALVDQGIDLLIENLEIDGLDAHEALTSFARDQGLARLSLDDGYGPVAYWEPEPVTVTFAGTAVSYPPYGFLQATQDGEAALVNAVKASVANASMIADLFSGIGTFALNLAEPAKVYAAEADRGAIQSLRSGANHAGKPVFTEHRDLFRRPLSDSELNRFGAVILDPPRAGAREQIMQLAKSQVPVVAYVSCNPASFARDAKHLIDGGYRLGRLWPVGQFRWSTHVELVGEFLKR